MQLILTAFVGNYKNVNCSLVGLHVYVPVYVIVRGIAKNRKWKFLFQVYHKKGDQLNLSF